MIAFLWYQPLIFSSKKSMWLYIISYRHYKMDEYFSWSESSKVFCLKSNNSVIIAQELPSSLVRFQRNLTHELIKLGCMYFLVRIHNHPPEIFYLTCHWNFQAFLSHWSSPFFYFESFRFSVVKCYSVNNVNDLKLHLKS